MAKIISISRSQQLPAQQPPSDVAIAILSWLKKKAPNTQRTYLGIASDWSRYLGAEFEDPRAGALWRKATHTNAQGYLLEAGKRPSQPGRASVEHRTVSDSTLRHKVMALLGMYSELVAQGLVAGSPFAKIRSDYKKVRNGDRRPHELVDYESVKRLLEPPDLSAIPKGPEWQLPKLEAIRNHAVMCLLFGGGLRRSELIKLRLGDVCASTKGTTYLVLRDTKAGHNQQQSLAPWIASAVRKLYSQRTAEGARESDFLFVCYYGHGIADVRGMSESTLYRLFKAICASVGLPPTITPHCARVTAITKLLDDGWNHRDVKEFSRHSSVQMVERYDRRRLSIDDSISKKITYD